MPMSLIATLKLVMDAKAMNAYDLEKISGVHQPTMTYASFSRRSLSIAFCLRLRSCSSDGKHHEFGNPR